MIMWIVTPKSRLLPIIIAIILLECFPFKIVETMFPNLKSRTLHGELVRLVPPTEVA